jgi:hypothetical protein
VGYFGRNGISDLPPPSDQSFQVTGDHGLWLATPQLMANEPLGYGSQPWLYLLAEGKLWAFNTQSREVSTLLDAPRASAIGHVWRALDKIPASPPGAMPLPAQYLTTQKPAGDIRRWKHRETRATTVLDHR